MKRMQMKILLLACTFSGFVGGCATVQKMGDSAADKMGVSKAAGGATVGAAVGCAGGAALGYLSGVGVRDGCLAGAVAGSVIGYMDGKQRDLDDAKKLAEEVNKFNSSAVADSSVPAGKQSAATLAPIVQERKVKVVRKNEPESEVAGFKSIEIPLPPNSVDAHSGGAQKTLGKIGNFAASRSTGTVVVISAATKDRIFIANSLQQGIESAKPSDAHAAKVSTASKVSAPRIRYVPLQKDGIPRVTVAPADVAV